MENTGDKGDLQELDKEEESRIKAICVEENINELSSQDMKQNDGQYVEHFNLIPSLTVAANIAFQSALSGTLDLAHIKHIVSALGLQEQMQKYPLAPSLLQIPLL